MIGSHCLQTTFGKVPVTIGGLLASYDILPCVERKSEMQFMTASCLSYSSLWNWILPPNSWSWCQENFSLSFYLTMHSYWNNERHFGMHGANPLVRVSQLTFSACRCGATPWPRAPVVGSTPFDAVRIRNAGGCILTCSQKPRLHAQIFGHNKVHGRDTSRFGLHSGRAARARSAIVFYSSQEDKCWQSRHAWSRITLQFKRTESRTNSFILPGEICRTQRFCRSRSTGWTPDFFKFFCLTSELSWQKQTRKCFARLFGFTEDFHEKIYRPPCFVNPTFIETKTTFQRSWFTHVQVFHAGHNFCTEKDRHGTMSPKQMRINGASPRHSSSPRSGLQLRVWLQINTQQV